jgi:4-alpha-glucanotransferase
MALHELARRVGILDEYFDVGGRRCFTSDDTRRAILHAMHIDASTDEAARHSLDQLVREDEARLLAPVRVAEVGQRLPLDVRTPGDREITGPWVLVIDLEGGKAKHHFSGPWRGGSTFPLEGLPSDLPIGYHRVRLTLAAGAREWSDEQTLIIVPPRCVGPADLLGDTAAFGVIANLYTMRSRSNWGVGDFSDLGSLAQWTAKIGGDFVGMNPLHALLNRGGDVSPYSPVSRLFRNIIYIDVTRIPELAYAPDLRDHLTSPEFAAELESLRDSPDVRYEQVMAVKGMALDALHRVFLDRVRGSGSARAAAYSRYVDEHEPAISRFATWMTIAEHERKWDWRTWPDDLRDPASEAVCAFQVAHANRIDFHRWTQFEADRQLGDAGACARAAGMRVGLYQDLAIGSAPSGADVWSFRDLFVHGVSAGAPPDPYSATGQNWGLPPVNPGALKRDGYRYFIDLIRTGFRHAGALRIDHVMGLFRLFWIPDGMTGAQGAYVTYPAGDLLGIIALESVRNGALVVGEDLGTVPDYVRPALSKWGILSSKVLYFEREWDGGFRGAASYPPLSLATANTHDMPTLAGFWAGRDVTLRRQVGQIGSDDEEARARDERDRDRGHLLRLLEAERILPQGSVPQSSAELRAAVHGFLWNTPAQLVGLSLDDLAGEIEPVNIPGIGPDRFASWTRKMRADLETITTSEDVNVAVPRRRQDGAAGR